MAALVARRGLSRSAPPLSLLLLRPQPSFQQRWRVGPPRQPAAGDGKWSGRGSRLWQSFPDTHIRVRGCQPPVSASRRAGRFLIWKKKIHLISFVNFSVRATSGGSCKLGHSGSTASGPGFGEPWDSGDRATSGRARRVGVSAGQWRARCEEGPPGALYGGGRPEWCAAGRPKLWCPLA